MDLFEDYESLPSEVNEIIAEFDEVEPSYNNCDELIKKLNTVGYTCEYGLDACPINLKKL